MSMSPVRIAISSGGVDVILFMTAVQVIHLFQVAEQMGCEDDLRAGLASIVVVSIGPTTSEELAHYGVKPDFEPSRPKMGFLVNEAAQYSGKVLEQKRAAKSSGESHSNGHAQAEPRTKKSKPPDSIAPKPDPQPVRKVQPSTPTMAGSSGVGLKSLSPSAVAPMSTRLPASCAGSKLGSSSFQAGMKRSGRVPVS